jgi:hypothetical protein
MDIRLISALLLASPLLGSSPTPVVLTAFLQLQTAPKEYGDSPRPGPISRLHMTESAIEKHLITSTPSTRKRLRPQVSKVKLFSDPYRNGWQGKGNSSAAREAAPHLGCYPGLDRPLRSAVLQDAGFSRTLIGAIRQLSVSN